jgi:tetratricopeptide (TPR) repeat protein
MLNDSELQAKGDAKEMAAVFKSAWELRDEPGAPKDLFERGLKFATARGDESPEDCLAILETVESAAPKPDAATASKQKILEKLTASHPADVVFLSKLAVVYERSKQRERCEALLKPQEKKLGTTEGARILGQLYIEKGKHEEAYSLLQPYLDARLQTLHKAEERYVSALEAAATRILNSIKNRTAPDFPYQRLEQAGEEEQQRIFLEYRDRQLARDADVKRATVALSQEMPVMDVAMDLGSLQAQRGRQMADPATRTKELERAEKTLLAVQGVAEIAGAGNPHHLRLAEVYYWLGKQQEGRKLFDKVLASEGRSYDVLYMVASRLRNLGEMSETRTLLEEAYKLPAADKQKRQQAAHLRAITQKDLDDQILWLERCDPTQSSTKADLASARGHKAEEEGKDEDAASLYREAVKYYEGQLENSAALNNGALIYQELFGVTGEREALDRALKMMEKAVALKPRDGILQGNTASFLKNAALRDLVGEKIDLSRLRRDGGIDLLAFLYQDQAGRKEWNRRIKENKGMERARTHLDRALLLSPKSVQLYLMLRELLLFSEDRVALRRLVEQAQESSPDISEIRQKVKESWEGKEEAKRRKELTSNIARARRRVEGTRPGGGVTFAVAATSQITSQLAGETIGLDFNADEVVKLAEEAHQAAPSAATASNLWTALLARASQSLSKSEPEYQAMVRRARRSLRSNDLIAVALWHDGKSRPAALNNEDVKRAIELIRDSTVKFPEDADAWDWVMLRAVHSDDAARVAESLKKNELPLLQRALDDKLTGPGASRAFRECWALDSAGKSKEAVDVLKRAKAEGVPLPFDP